MKKSKLFFTTITSRNSRCEDTYLVFTDSETEAHKLLLEETGLKQDISKINELSPNKKVTRVHRGFVEVRTAGGTPAFLDGDL